MLPCLKHIGHPKMRKIENELKSDFDDLKLIRQDAGVPYLFFKQLEMAFDVYCTVGRAAKSTKMTPLQRK